MPKLAASSAFLACWGAALATGTAQNTAGTNSPSESKVPDVQRNAKPSLACATTALVAGETGTLALTFEIRPGWHMYWKGQNVAGMPFQITWGLPAGISVGEGQWPVPERDIVDGDIINYTYHDRFTVLFPVTVSKDAAGSTLTIAANLEWLVCESGCVLETGADFLDIPILPAGVKPADSSAAADIATARSKLPASPDIGRKTFKTTVFGDNQSVTIALTDPSQGVAKLVFLPDEGGVTMKDPISSGESTTGGLRFQYEDPGAKPRAEGQPVPTEVRGLVGIWLSAAPESPRWYEVREPLPAK